MSRGVFGVNEESERKTRRLQEDEDVQERGEDEELQERGEGQG